MQYPNVRSLQVYTQKSIGGSSDGFSLYFRGRGDRWDRYVGENWDKSAGGLASGVYPPGAVTILPRVIGATTITTTLGVALAFTAAPQAGSGFMTSAPASLSFTCGASLRTPVSFSAPAFLGLTIPVRALVSVGVISMPGTLAMSQPLLRATWSTSFAAPAALGCNVTVKGLGAVAASMTSYTDLSPQNLANAVWSKVLP